jgi:hypothetical protein
MFGVLAAILAITAACNNDDDDDTDASTSATASVCDQVDAVDSAVTDLTDIDVLAEGTDALNASVANVQSELDQLKTVVSDDVQDEVDALDTALSDADDLLSGIGDDATLNEKIDDVQAAFTGVATASAALVTALIGRFNGKYFIERRPGLKAKVAPVQAFFQTNQLQILLTYRFLYGFRVIIPLLIGMSAVKPLKYLFYTLLGGVFWASTVTTVGYWFGRFLDLEASSFEENFIIIAICFGCFGIMMGYLIKRIAFRKIVF